MKTIWQSVMDTLRSGQSPNSGGETDSDITQCIETIVVPALTAARQTLEAEGYEVTLDHTDKTASLKVKKSDGSFAFYTVEGRLFFYSAFAFPMLHGRKDRPRFGKFVIETNGGSHAYRCKTCTSDFLRDECLETCRRWLDW